MDQKQFQEQSRLSQSSSQNEVNQPEDTKFQAKTFMHPDFNKAKRNVTKLVDAFFKKLREDIKYGAKLHLSRSKISNIEEALIDYTGIRYNGKGYRLELKVAEVSKNKQKGGIWSYISEGQKIVSLNHVGKVMETKIIKGQYKLPDVATPVGFQTNIYLLDPCNFDVKRNVFVPSPPAFEINWQGKLKQIAPPIFFRNKCAVVRKKDFVYLLGGEATERKILTNRCQRYNLKHQTSEEIPSMRHKHMCPSACFLGTQLWVFSQQYLQFLEQDKQNWVNVSLPFNCRFLPFQFATAINENQIILFGGTINNQKSRQVKIYNTKYHNINYYGQILPQGMSHERNSCPAVINGCLAAMTSVQASIYPRVGLKSNMCQVVSIFESTAFLSSVIVI